MKISSREGVLAWVTAVVILIALTYMYCEPRVREFAKMREEQAKISEKMLMDERLVAQRANWQHKMDEVSQSLPQFPSEKDVTADLLITLERIAKECAVVLPRREAEKEKKHSDIYEMAIVCRWEGSLESLVHFLFELQQQGAMLDMTQLSVTPEKGLLKGGFTVNCAYRRVSEPPAQPAPALPPVMNKSKGG